MPQDPEASGLPIPEESEPGPSITPQPEVDAQAAAERVRQMAAREGAGEALKNLAGEAAKTEANPERAKQVQELQIALREVNTRPEVGGKMLVEMPLGDESGRVVQVIRPDAIDSILPIMDEEFNKNLPEGSQIDGELVRSFADQRIAIVLPEVGMAWIRTDKGTRPGTIKSEVTRVLDHQGAKPGNFLGLAKAEGLKFAVHRGMEEDDRPSYIPNEMIDERGATIIQRNPAREASEEVHWQGGVGLSVMETVRGEASAEMFNRAVAGAYEKARDQVRFQGPSPDKLISSTLAVIQGLK